MASHTKITSSPVSWKKNVFLNDPHTLNKHTHTRTDGKRGREGERERERERGREGERECVCVFGVVEA